MGQGQSRNLFEAAASDELERARYFIDHDSADVNGKDKVIISRRKLHLDWETCDVLLCASLSGYACASDVFKTLKTWFAITMKFSHLAITVNFWIGHYVELLDSQRYQTSQV